MWTKSTQEKHWCKDILNKTQVVTGSLQGYKSEKTVNIEKF